MKHYRLFITLLLIAMTAQITLAGDVIKVCGQNLQNLFWTLDRTRTTTNGVPMSNYTTEDGRNAKLDIIASTLYAAQADIYAFNEVECNMEILNALAERLTLFAGTEYQAVADGLSYDLASEPSGIIKSGFIYKTATVKPYGNNCSLSGNNYIYSRTMRLQAFESLASGERFTLTMNHFKAGDPETNWEARVTNATNLLNGLSQAPDPDILIMGDLNSMIGEQCLQKLLDAGYEEMILKYNPNAYSFVYYYEQELIDHVFANESMAAQVTNAKVMHWANPTSVGTNNAYSDHDPYMVELELKKNENATSYVKATEVKAGNKYLIVALGEGNVRKLCGTVAGNYGTAPAVDAIEENGAITLEVESQLFTFEDAGGGLFYIKDANGRYLSNGAKSSSGYYTTFTPTTLSNAHKFTVTKRADDRFTMTNTTSGYLIYYGDPSYQYAANVFTCYYNANNSLQQLPFLYEKSTTSAITDNSFYSQPTTTRKVMENGRLIIVTDKGQKYTMTGIEIK